MNLNTINNHIRFFCCTILACIVVGMAADVSYAARGPIPLPKPIFECSHKMQTCDGWRM
ncbi:MAG: hypothetical protein AAF702_24660 [Chloroflexota bacterium]